jgi:serine/threonine protein kinase
LPFSLKKKLCREVGYGLWALHSAGIVHGDLKSENVLIRDADDASGVIAKLADFGFAITDLALSDTSNLPAFTLPWNAPESHDQLPRDLLQYTDVYSYGLIVWRVILDGANPFRHINTLASLDKAEFQRQVEILKMEDRVLPLAKSTLRNPFCSTEESYLIANVLNSTLQLDASKRNLHFSLKLLRELKWAGPSPIEPLMQYEYENVICDLFWIYLDDRDFAYTLLRSTYRLLAAAVQLDLSITIMVHNDTWP